MKITTQIAKHLKEVYFGGNWTWSNLQETLKDVTWQQATQKLDDFNTIAALVYHIDYFVAAAIPVLEGKPLDAHDKYSFDVPAIRSQTDWEALQQQAWDNARELIALIENLPDSILNVYFTDEKYGNFFRNLHGTIEHAHYHLGQIVILKKLVQGMEFEKEEPEAEEE